MTDHNSDTVVQDGIKPVLIGQIIADEDRQQWFLAGYPGGDPLQCLALVPIHIRSKFDDFTTRGHLEPTAAADVMHGCGHSAGRFRCCIAVVHRDGVPLVFH